MPNYNLIFRSDTGKTETIEFVILSNPIYHGSFLFYPASYDSLFPITDEHKERPIKRIQDICSYYDTLNDPYLYCYEFNENNNGTIGLCAPDYFKDRHIMLRMHYHPVYEQMKDAVEDFTSDRDDIECPLPPTPPPHSPLPISPVLAQNARSVSGLNTRSLTDSPIPPSNSSQSILPLPAVSTRNLSPYSVRRMSEQKSIIRLGSTPGSESFSRVTTASPPSVSNSIRQITPVVAPSAPLTFVRKHPDINTNIQTLRPTPRHI